MKDAFSKLLTFWPSDRSLHLLVQHCKRLRTLDISKCKNITVTTVDVLQSQLPFLENIHHKFIGGMDLTLTLWLNEWISWIQKTKHKTCGPKPAWWVRPLHISAILSKKWRKCRAAVGSLLKITSCVLAHTTSSWVSPIWINICLHLYIFRLRNVCVRRQIQKNQTQQIRWNSTIFLICWDKFEWMK